MRVAAKLLITFSSASLLIYIVTFRSNIRRQLRECSCALSFTFLLLGVIVQLYLENDWHCSNSFLCPLSTFLSIFSFLSCSVLYLFFTSNIIVELKSFFTSLSLHPKQIDKLPYRWAHLIAWCFMFVLSAVLTTVALPDYKTGVGSKIQPQPILKICFFTEEWPVYVIAICHMIFISASIGCIVCCLYHIAALLPLLGYLSPSGQWNIRLYTIRLSALLVCLLFHLGATLFALVLFNRYNSTYTEDSVTRHVQCHRTKGGECELKSNLSCLMYILYSLEFCCFVQGLWPLDASTIRYLVGQFVPRDDQSDQLKLIPNFYIKGRRKDLNSSVILRNASSKSHPSTSDNSTVEQWLYSNRLITRRPATIPTNLIPNLKHSRTPEFRRRKCLKKSRTKNWSVKEGFTPHHQRILHRKSSGSESSDVDNWQARFSNYSISHEGYLNAAIDKINEMGVSTTQSEPSDQRSDVGELSLMMMPSFNESRLYSCLDQIRLSDLTSDEEYSQM